MSIKEKLQEIEKQYWMSGDTKMSEVFLELISDLGDDLEEAYNNGKDSGYESGYDIGYDDGSNETRSEVKEEMIAHLENNDVSDRVIKLVKEVL